MWDDNRQSSEPKAIRDEFLVSHFSRMNKCQKVAERSQNRRESVSLILLLNLVMVAGQCIVRRQPGNAWNVAVLYGNGDGK